MSRLRLTEPQARLLRRASERDKPLPVRGAQLVPARTLAHLKLVKLGFNGQPWVGVWWWEITPTDAGRSWLSADPVANVVGDKELP